MNRKPHETAGKGSDGASPAQVDPATLNRINRKKVEKQTQAVTREKRQDRPVPSSGR